VGQVWRQLQLCGTGDGSCWIWNDSATRIRQSRPSYLRPHVDVYLHQLQHAHMADFRTCCCCCCWWCCCCCSVCLRALCGTCTCTTCSAHPGWKSLSGSTCGQHSAAATTIYMQAY
jgi:hypothetical protein